MQPENSQDRVLKWEVRRRLEFIDFRLFWDARLNRRDLMECFRISAQQASTDIDRYAEIAPGNLEYDRVAKTFVRGLDYRPVFVGGFADRYLLQLQALKLNWMDKDQTWFDSLPPAEVVRLRHRALDDDVLRPVLDAIREHRQLRVEYWPMSGKPAAERVIAPHALAYCEGRWHARAWNADNADFRDFTLNRMSRVVLDEPSGIGPEQDFEWQLRAEMVLEPNPVLTDVESAAVRREYEFEGDRLIVKTRLALVFYLKAQHNLDIAADDIRPKKQQLVLLNGDELDEKIRAARAMSGMALATRAR